MCQVEFAQRQLPILCVCICTPSLCLSVCLSMLLHFWFCVCGGRRPVWADAGGVLQSAGSAGLAGSSHQTNTHSSHPGTLAQASVRLPHSKNNSFKQLVSRLYSNVLPSYGIWLCFYFTQLLLLLPVALSSRHSLQTLRVSWRERWTHLPHPSSSVFMWDGPQWQPNVGATWATEYPPTLEPELPPPCASSPALSCSLPEGGAVHWYTKRSLILYGVLYRTE